MANVEVAAGALGPRVEAVLRLRRALQRSVVYRVCPCVAHDEAQTAPGSLRQCSLEPVIVRGISVLDKVDVSEEGEARIEGTRARHRVKLVDVAYAVELGSLVADICDL